MPGNDDARLAAGRREPGWPNPPESYAATLTPGKKRKSGHDESNAPRDGSPGTGHPIHTRSPSKAPRTPAAAHPSAAAAASTTAAPSHPSPNSALTSLHKRMAGPSSNKAGLALDQDEINRIIYDASKGSKYFENERIRDEDTTRRIQELHARMQHALELTPPGSEAWRKLEARADELVLRLEASRDLSRVILHCDMDMFYAAVELKRDPSLAGKEFGVGSGVLVTASYEARKYGVRSGMAQHIALALCPHLTIVKSDMQSYVEHSRQVMEVLSRYDENLCQVSLDEAYLDITPYCQVHDVDVEEAVCELRDEVRKATGLTASVGIAPNKMLAKISSDKNKPNGQFRVPSDQRFIVDFVKDLAVRKVPGIGRVTERILDSLEVRTCGDILAKRALLLLLFEGQAGVEAYLSAGLGLGSNVVEPAKRSERRSVGREHTFRPTSDVPTLLAHLEESVDRLAEDMERLEYRARTVTLTCKLDTFRRFTRAKTLERHCWRRDEIWSVAKRLFDQELAERSRNVHAPPPRGGGGAAGAPAASSFCLRLLGVRLSHLRDMRAAQQSRAALHTALRRASEQSPNKPLLQTLGDGTDEAVVVDGGRGSSPGGTTRPEPVVAAFETQTAPVERDGPPRSATGAIADDTGVPQVTTARSAEDGVDGDDAATAPTTKTTTMTTVECPVCGTRFASRTSVLSGKANVELNRHIDRCLSGEGSGGSGGATSGDPRGGGGGGSRMGSTQRVRPGVPRPQQKRGKPGPLDRLLGMRSGAAVKKPPRGGSADPRDAP